MQFHFLTDRRGSVFATASLLACLLAGCGGPAGSERLAVRGAILFDSTPLKAGRISFTPTESTKGPSAVATVSDGFYEFDARTGPVIGKNKVQIESLPDVGFELDDEAAYAKAASEKQGRPVLPADPIPPEYNERSTLVVTIDRKGEKKFDFTLEKPAKKKVH